MKKLIMLLALFVPKIAMAYDCGAARDAVVHIMGRD